MTKHSRKVFGVSSFEVRGRRLRLTLLVVRLKVRLFPLGSIMSSALNPRGAAKSLTITRCSILRCLAAVCSAISCASESFNGQDTHNAIERFQVGNVRHALDAGIQLGSSHTSLAKSRQWIDVSWKGVQDPQDDDFIALYAPANVSVYSTSPLKYKWAVSTPSHRKEGAGSIRYHARHFALIPTAFWPAAPDTLQLLTPLCMVQLSLAQHENRHEAGICAQWL